MLALVECCGLLVPLSAWDAYGGANGEGTPEDSGDEASAVCLDSGALAACFGVWLTVAEAWLWPSFLGLKL